MKVAKLKMLKNLALTVLIGAGAVSWAQATPDPTGDEEFLPSAIKGSKDVLQGQLREKGTRKPLASVNIYCFSPPEIQTPLKVMTDEKGEFEIHVPPGPIRWKITVANYKVFEKTDDASLTEPRKFYLEKNSYLVYETTVFGKGEKRDDKTQSLTQEQFMTMPGANGDPVKAVQNLPGVARTNALIAQVIV
jgi:hypothetical protein